MDTALSLVQSLGINSTVWTQLVIFLITFSALYGIVFRPYFKAHFERHARTTGGRESTGHLLESNQSLQNEYDNKIRQVNDRIRLSFEKAKTQALTEQANILGQARDQSSQLIRRSREKLEHELQEARSELAQEVREIGVIIAHKLIGSEKSGNGREAHQ